MAFTKITGYGISETTNVHVGMITSTNGVQGVGIFSGGTAVHSGVITSLNFIGTGNTFAVAGGKVDIISSGKNAMSAGPITLAGSVVVTIPSGSTWTVV
jgi:hypothetical protein